MSSNPFNIPEKYLSYPEDTALYTMVSAIHPIHGTAVFYVSADDWHGAIRGLLSPFWINGFTITMIPMD